jgi:hypothetical protein
MQYQVLKSIVVSPKGPVASQNSSDSFFVKPTRVAPYIEPSFSRSNSPGWLLVLRSAAELSYSHKRNSKEIIPWHPEKKQLRRNPHLRFQPH